MRANRAMVVVACVCVLPAMACQRETSSGEPVSLTKAREWAPGVEFYAPGPERPVPLVQFALPDLTTSAGSGVLHVLVGNLGAPIGANLLNQIAQALALKTWPGGSAVPTTISRIVDAAGKSNQDQFAHIDLLPAGTLADAWYALTIDALPSGVAWAPHMTGVAVGRGGRATRFRVGSGVLLSSVRAYSKASGKQVVYVDFSEGVSWNTSVDVSYDDGSSTGCQSESSGASIAGAATGKDATGMTLPPGESAVKSVTSIRLGCANGIDLARQIVVNAQPAVAVGKTAGTADVLTLVIRPDAWSDLGDGGRMFRPTSP